MPRDNERSPLWSIAAGGAAITGVGIGLYKSRDELREALKVASKDIASDTAKIASSMPRLKTRLSNLSVEALNDFQKDVLAISSHQDLLRRDIATAAYSSLLSGRQVSRDQAYSSFQNILRQSDVSASYIEAGKQLQMHGGDIRSFASRISTISKGGFYDPDRIKMMENVVTSTGVFDVSRRTLTREQLPSNALERLRLIEKRFSDASGTKGLRLNFKKFHMAGNTPMAIGNLAGITINMPLADTGITYSGENLTAEYITRASYDPKTFQLKGYMDRYTDTIEDIIRNNSNAFEAKRSLIAAHTDLIQGMFDKEGVASQAVFSMPEEALTSGGLVRRRLLKTQAVPNAEGFNIKNAEDLARHNLFAIGSADTVAKGTLYTEDIAETLFGDLGKLMPIEKQPLQFIRDEWGVTEAGKRIAAENPFSGTFGQYYSRLDRKAGLVNYENWSKIIHGGEDVTSARAYSSPQLATFYAKTGDVGFQNELLNKELFAEEAAIRAEAANMLQHERIVTERISLQEGFDVHKGVQENLIGKSVGEYTPLDIGSKQKIGVSLSGKEIITDFDQSLGYRSKVVGARLLGNNEAMIYKKEIYDLTQNEYQKYFAEDIKFMAKSRQNKEFNWLLKAADIEENIAGQRIDAMYSSKLLTRNPMALISQQTEALSMFAANRIDSGQLKGIALETAQELLSNPNKKLGMSEAIKNNLATAEFEIQKNMVNTARSLGLSDRELGLTFGLMNKESAALLGIGSQVEASQGVIGLSKMRIGDIASDNVGQLASIEHTGLRLLSMKGKEGQRMVADIGGRFINKGEFSSANLALQSLTNTIGIEEKAKSLIGRSGIKTDPVNLIDMKAEDLIRKEGRFVNIGKNINDFGGSNKIYIPGTNEAPLMTTGSLSNKGELIPSEYTRNLQNFREALQSGDDVSISEAAKELKASTYNFFEEQGAGRGRVRGSRFLTGISSKKQDNIFRISRESGTGMFDEMIESATDSSQRDFLKSQKAKFLAGDTLSGGIWRHPTTGPESFQFVNYKMGRDLKGPMISAPVSRGTLNLNGISQVVDTSQMVGLKGDFDKDMFALTAISDQKTSEMVTKGLQEGSINKQYQQYLFEHYAAKQSIKDAIESKNIAAANIMSREQQIAVGAKNLTEAKLATPEINLSLQKFKLGLMYNAPEKYRGMADLFWHLEESAIGGKHGALDTGGEIYQNIAKAQRTRDYKLMEETLNSVFKNQKEYRGSLQIGKDVVNSSWSINTGEVSRTMIDSAAAVSDDVDAAFAASRVAKGKMSISDTNQIVEGMIRRKHSIDVAQRVMDLPASKMEGISELAHTKARQGITKAKAIGKALGRNKLPILAGLGAAAGIALMAPAVTGTLNPEGPAGGKNLSGQDVIPPSAPPMNPPEPRIMRSPQVHSVSGNKTANRANIRMSYRDANASSGEFRRFTSDLSKNGNIRVRSIDDRSVLDPQRLADKIHERL